MNAHVAESDRPQKTAGADDEFGAPRLAGHHEPRKLRDARKEANQLIVGEVMQEEVAGDNICARRPGICQKVENIRRARFRAPAQSCKRIACRTTYNVLLVLENN